MKIELQKIKIKDLYNGYVNNSVNGVFAYGGLLNIRPKYQREFTYEKERQIAVIETIVAGFPLNVMYWVKNKDESFELLDGQQRTLSICKFLNGEFSILLDKIPHYFSNIKTNNPSLEAQILEYELMCYFCEDADDVEKLKWFKTINIAGKVLNDQELLNASFTGKWLNDAKSKFSKPDNCPAEKEANKYIKGIPIEQDYLATALKWIAHRDKIDVEQYMAQNQGKDNCNDLWSYFKSVITWVETIFDPKVYRKEMKGMEWGELYNLHYKDDYDAKTLEEKFLEINNDPNINSSVQNIYRYLVTKDENLLNRRVFDDKIKRKVFEKQKKDKNTDKAICPDCNGLFDYSEMEGDHIKPWSKGGLSTIENCQMLCKSCNGKKSNKS